MKKLIPLLLLFSVCAYAQNQIFPVGGVVTINCSGGTNSVKVIVTATVSSVVFANPTAGQIVTVLFQQDATGHTVTFSGNVAGTPTVSSTANAATVLTFQYDASANTWNQVGAGSVSLPTTLSAAGAFTISSACLTTSANCLQMVDDDSTDNCGTALTNWLALVNGYSGLGTPQVWITGTVGSGKAFKLATSGCELSFTNVLGVDVHLWATIDCAQASQACIQLGATSTSGASVNYSTKQQSYRLTGGGSLIGGTALTGVGGNGSGTAAGVYVMPQIGGVYIDGITFGGSGTNLGFGATAAMGSCTNWSVYFDFPLPDGVVSHVLDSVNSTSTTAGGCGLGNPNGASKSSNTVFFDDNIIFTNGEVSGAGFCGSVGISDGGSLGGIAENNIFGFAIPTQLLGIGHRLHHNQLDSTQCAAGGVSAVIQFGGAGVVGPATIEGNVAQVGTSQGKATDFFAEQNGATATITGINIISNQNTNSAVAPLIGGSLNCTPNVSYCLELSNTNFTPTTSCGSTSSGWQQGSILADCFPAGTANLAATSLYTSNGTPSALVTCQVILSRAATTSSTLPQCVIGWTDAFTGVAQSVTITPAWASGTIGCSGSTTNTLGNSCQGSILITPSNASNVTFSTVNYASSGATSMQYSLNVVAARQ